MDAIDILGDLLGHKTRKSGRGSDALKDIFGRKSGRPSVARPPQPDEIKREANELEDLLHVANNRKKQSTERGGDFKTPSQKRSANHRNAAPDLDHTDNERALALVRAMVNAAKADGQLDRHEQQEIFARMGNASSETVAFLQREFEQPLNVDQFVRQVPIGMEQQVYKLSLITIDLDTRKEAEYLQRLADGLRIPLSIREKIHTDLGARRK